jgi:aminopeptidase N
MLRYLTVYCLILLTANCFAQLGHVEEVAKGEQTAFASKVQFKTNAAPYHYDVKYYRLAVYLDPRVYYIKGSVTVYFSATQNLSQLTLDLVNSMNVDSIIYHEDTVSFIRTGNDEVQAIFPQSIASGSFDSLTVYYKGIPRTTGLGSFASNEHETDFAIWSLSQPYGSREWWPNKMTLDDKADSLDVYITTPQQYRGASNGLLITDVINDTLRTVYWKHRYPIAAYLIAVAASNYVVYADYYVKQNDSLEILNYVYPQYETTARVLSPFTVKCLALFDSLFVPYPFSKEKYGHAQFGRGGGMEHQTMSFMYNFSPDLVAHELAHQWFGDKVTCGSWRDIWLNEGFATYLTGLTYENLRHDSLWMKWKRSQINNIVSQPYGSVYPVDTVNVFALFDSRLTYVKASYVLHMLRWVMGDVKFFQGVKNHLNDTSQIYGFATTSAFIRHMEKAYGAQLDWFFDQWYYKEGYPTYSTEWQQKDDQVFLKVSQTTSHPSVNFFKMPLEYLIIGKAGDSAYVSFTHTDNGQVFTANVNFEIDTIVFDPKLRLVSKDNRLINKTDLINQAKGLHVYPNPFEGNIKISFANTRWSNPVVELYNILGQKMKEQSFTGTPYIIDWNVGVLPVGCYFIRISSGDDVVQLKLIAR